jgi:DNA-binding MarR family transcriptional regulator
VFITLFHAVNDDGALRSDDIADRTKLSRGTVVHHLNKLRDRNIVARANNEYFLRVDSLATLTEEIRNDVNDALDDIEAVAKRIDDQLGLDG